MRVAIFNFDALDFCRDEKDKIIFFKNYDEAEDNSFKHVKWDTYCNVDFDDEDNSLEDTWECIVKLVNQANPHLPKIPIPSCF